MRGRVKEGSSETYSAHDPDLQRWVHATLLESIPLTYEMLVGPLTRDQRDQYCSEAAIMEPLLGMPDGWLPRESAQLDTYMREMLASGRLVVTDTSRALARSLLYPPQWYLAWPAFRAMQLITIGTLPPSIRAGLRVRVARTRPTRARALDDGAADVATAAALDRTRVAGGETLCPTCSAGASAQRRTRTATRSMTASGACSCSAGRRAR